MQEFMKHVEGVTEDLNRFVDEEVFGDKEFVFIKKGIAFCTKCKSEYEVDELGINHNDIGRCEICGSDIQVKLARYKHSRLSNEACLYYFSKSPVDPKVVVCRGYYVNRTYEDYKNPKTEYSLKAVYLFGHGYNNMYKDSYWTRFGETSSIYDFNIGWMSRCMCYANFDSLKEVIKDTELQYMQYRKHMGHISMVKLMSQYIKYPWLEYLDKMGLEELVIAKVKGLNTFRCLNYRGKDIFKILGITKPELKKIRKAKIPKINASFIKLYQQNIKDGSMLRPEEVSDINRTLCAPWDWIETAKYSSLRKVYRYLKKQKDKYGKENTTYYGLPVYTYKDYLHMCENLKMDMKDEHVLFPKNVWKEHDNAMIRVKVEKDKVLDKKIKARQKSLNKYRFEYKGLLIKPIESLEEILNEGNKLHHCVATCYLKPYANSQTIILVVRKVDNPTKPYVTVEVKEGRIKQAYGNHDTTPPKEVLDFLEEFKHEILKIKQKAS